VGQREISLPIHAGSGVTVSEPLVVKWRKIRIRPIPPAAPRPGPPASRE
jgi:hypothetical protein